MKILLIGNNFFQYCYAFEKALKDLNNEVVTCRLNDTWKKTLPGKIYIRKNRILDFLYGRTGQVGRHPEWARKTESKKVLELYQKFNPDLVISFAAYILAADALKKMEKAKKIIWIYDSIFNLTSIYPTIKHYDKIFIFEKNDCCFFNKLKKNSEFLPLCADSATYFPIKNRKKDIDICFVGDLTVERLNLFRELIKEFPDNKIVIYGKYVSKFNLFGHLQRKLNGEDRIFTNQFLSPDKANELYSRSKICINLHRQQSQYGGNMRLYELMAAAAFQITNSNQYIEENFSDCLKTYTDISDLIKKVRYYLENENERNKISQKGYKKVLSSECFIDRAQYILNHISDI